MPQPTQATRNIAIDTPLGEDVLLLRNFSGHEEISRLSEFDLDLLSEDYEINFDDIIGQNVTIRMELPEGGTRYWNGYINRFVQGVSSSVRFARYRATMVPWLWFLTRTSDCRIFQEKTVPDIIKEVFNDLGFSDIEDRLSGGYRTWTYCVQYRETDFNFVSRLMEQEGIYYYFLHESGKCTIVLCDSRSKHDTWGNYGEIDFIADAQGSAILERISEWTVEKRVQPGNFAHVDYNFEKPSTSLMSIIELKMPHAKADYEIYDHPGEYLEKTDGDKYAKVRMEELAHSHEVCSGQSDSRGICSGYLFTLDRHSRRDQNREYLVVSTGYQAAAEAYETSDQMNEMCVCSFTVIPSSVQFRPQRSTPKPIIQGSQTAMVTGPSGEEIYTDEHGHGRVKVQFHWDREGEYDQNTSCWIRVSQVHAGKSFGGIDIPRIGEEVIVSFMEGDPDQPIITGRVYNAELMPPFGLPGKKMVSGMKSNSTPGGGGYNEMSMDDSKGKENITIHAQKDMATTVENNRTATIKSGNDATTVQSGTRSVTVKGDTSLTVQAGSRIVSVTGGDFSVKASDAVLMKGSGKGAGIEGSGGKGVEIKGNGSVGVGISGNPNFVAVGETEARVYSKDVLVHADASVSISVGGSQIEVTSSAIKISGSSSVEIKGGGGTVKLDGGGVTVSGGMVKINC